MLMFKNKLRLPIIPKTKDFRTIVPLLIIKWMNATLFIGTDIVFYKVLEDKTSLIFIYSLIHTL